MRTEHIVISNAIDYAISPINSLVTVYITLLRCSRPASIGTVPIPVDCILIFILATLYYAKTQSKLNIFDQWFLQLGADLDRQNSTIQLFSTSSY